VARGAIPEVMTPPTGKDQKVAPMGRRDEVGSTTATDGGPVKVDAPVAAGSPKADSSRTPTSRFVGAAALAGTADAGSAAPPLTDGEDQPATPPGPVGHRRVSGRVFILLVVVLLVIGAIGGWYYKRNHSSSATAVEGSAQTQADLVLATRLGVHATDLPGWTTTPGSVAAFAPVAVSSAAATAAAARASTALGQCLHVPTAEVTAAFGVPSPARSAGAVTPTFNDPGTPGTTASSVVDVMRDAATVTDDSKVFADPALFASCYQPYAQTMLPYVEPASAAPFTSVAVQATAVPVASASRIQVEAFRITRARTGASVVTTAVAIFGGRVQTTVAMTSPTTFPASVESSLVTALEGRVAASPST